LAAIAGKPCVSKTNILQRNEACSHAIENEKKTVLIYISGTKGFFFFEKLHQRIFEIELKS